MTMGEQQAVRKFNTLHGMSFMSTPLFVPPYAHLLYRRFNYV